MKNIIFIGILSIASTFSATLHSTTNRPLPMQEVWFEYEAHQNEDGTYEIHCTGPGFYCKTLVF